MVVRSTTGVYVKPDSVLARTAREMVEAHFGGSGPRDGVTVCPTCGDPLPCAAGRAAAEVLAAAGLAQTAQASGLVQAARQGLPTGAGAPPSPLGQSPFGPVSPGPAAHGHPQPPQPPLGQAPPGPGPVGQGPLGQGPHGQGPLGPARTGPGQVGQPQPGASVPERPHAPGRSEEPAGRRQESGSPGGGSPFVQRQAEPSHPVQPPSGPPAAPGRRARTVGDQAVDRPGPEQPLPGRPFEAGVPVERPAERPADGPPPFGRGDEAPEPQERSGRAAPLGFKGWAEINQETAAESGRPTPPPAGPHASAARDGGRQPGLPTDHSPEPVPFDRPGSLGPGDEPGQFGRPGRVHHDYPAHPLEQPERTRVPERPDRQPFGGHSFTLGDQPQAGAASPAGRPGDGSSGLNGYHPHGSAPAGGAPGGDGRPPATAPGAPQSPGFAQGSPGWTPGGGTPMSEEGADSPPSGLPQRPDGDGRPPSPGASPAA